jgi:hypothetical protein
MIGSVDLNPVSSEKGDADSSSKCESQPPRYAIYRRSAEAQIGGRSLPVSPPKRSLGMAPLPMSKPVISITSLARWSSDCDTVARAFSFHVDDSLELGRVLYRKITGPFTLQDAIDIVRCAPIEISWLDAVRHQAAGRDEVVVGVDRRPVTPGSEFNHRRRDAALR